MIRIIILMAAVALSAAIPADAQNSRIMENYLQIGGGTFSELPYCHTGNPLGCIQASYGLDIRTAGRWSVMPAAGINDQDNYYIGWLAREPSLDGMTKFGTYDFGVKPGVYCLLGKHFMLGPGTRGLSLNT